MTVKNGPMFGVVAATIDARNAESRTSNPIRAKKSYMRRQCTVMDDVGGAGDPDGSVGF